MWKYCMFFFLLFSLFPRWKSLHLYIKGEYFLHTCQLDQVWSYSLDIFKYGKFTIRKEKIPYAI